MRIFLIISLLILWIGLGWMYYVDHKKCCSANQNDVIGLQAPEPMISFVWDNAQPTFKTKWTVFKDSISALVDSTHHLEIVGYRCENESEGIGILRARMLRETFSELKDDRIIIRSVMTICDSTHRDLPFEACEFDTRVKTKLIKEEDDGKVLIYFPPNSNDRINNAEIEIYLNQLADKLKSNQSTLKITGFTDNQGDESQNFSLGLARAMAIKEFIQSKGIDSQRIEASSLSESQPIGNNETEEGRAKNRRTEIIIHF